MQYIFKYWKVLAVAVALVVAYGVGKHSFHPAPALHPAAHVAAVHKPTPQQTIIAILAKLSVQDRAVMVRALRASRAAIWQHRTPAIVFHAPAKHKAAHKQTAKKNTHKKHKHTGTKKETTK